MIYLSRLNINLENRNNHAFEISATGNAGVYASRFIKKNLLRHVILCMFLMNFPFHGRVLGIEEFVIFTENFQFFSGKSSSNGKTFSTITSVFNVCMH